MTTQTRTSNKEAFYRRFNTRYSLLWALLIAVNIATAADISHEVRQGPVDTSGDDINGFLEFSSTAGLHRIPLIGFFDNDSTQPEDAQGSVAITLGGLLEWRGFFLEALYESSNNGAIGYQFSESERSRVALILTSQMGEYSPGIVEGYESVDNRNSDLLFGLRSTHYRGNSVIQLELLTDVSGRNEGLHAAWQFGHNWQVRNWNMHMLLAARYFSASTVNYYFGITPDEATANIPQYKAGSGLLTTIEVGAAIPINEKWVFKTAANINRLPDSVVNSPLATARMAYDATAGLSYVF